MGLLSFIVPAHNEEYELGGTLDAIFQAAKAVGEPFEVLVVNDDSTDKTREIAQNKGARILDVQLRKISAVRNAGAKQAQGDFFFFVDADTRVSEPLLRAALQALNGGAIGGGAWVTFYDPAPSWVRIALRVFNFFYMGICRWAAGCFIFARRAAFQAAGGFDETLFASEEIFLSSKLKQQGRFAIVRETVATSNRKLRLHSAWSIVPFFWRFLRGGMGILKQREGLEFWYDGKREK